MPHYRDGTEAQIGDLVVGTSYNRDGRTIVGQVTSITPGVESCNLRVAFISTFDLQISYGIVSGMVIDIGQGGRKVLIKADEDYGQTSSFDLVYRAMEVGK